MELWRREIKGKKRMQEEREREGCRNLTTEGQLRSFFSILLISPLLNLYLSPPMKRRIFL